MHVAKAVLLLPLALYLVFIVSERKGYWDQLRGLHLVQEIAERFERSVGPDDAIPVRAGDPQFAPTISLIQRYSPKKLASDKTPQVIARGRANVYDAQPQGPDEKLAQWTSPVTPVVVFYYDWPNVKFPDGKIPTDQYIVIGTLGDLHEWIARSREDFHFLFVDLLLVGIVPLMIGVYEYIVEIKFEKWSAQNDR